MATDRRLRAALLTKLGNVSPQRLSQLVAEIKRGYGPITTTDGTYVLAHLRGLDLTKFLDPPTCDRIRSILQRAPHAGAVARPGADKQSSRPSRVRKPKVIRQVQIGSKVASVDPLLPPSVLNDALRMAELYPRLYVFENSLRNVIARVLKAKHGEDWWSHCAPPDLQKRVRGRIDSELRAPWHAKRGDHEIKYSDFSDLARIVETNQSDFGQIIPAWVTQKLAELEPARNTLAHHNPVSAKEQARLEVYSDDWAALIRDRQALIP